jgi:hypothetical protein
LNSYGVRGRANVWFESYISHRGQYVEINHKVITNLQQRKYVSVLREMGLDVPQGSILGPLLFLLYTNNLSLNSTGSKVVLFADDKYFGDSGK